MTRNEVEQETNDMEARVDFARLKAIVKSADFLSTYVIDHSFGEIGKRQPFGNDLHN